MDIHKEGYGMLLFLQIHGDVLEAVPASNTDTSSSHLQLYPLSSRVPVILEDRASAPPAWLPPASVMFVEGAWSEPADGRSVSAFVSFLMCLWFSKK